MDLTPPRCYLLVYASLYDRLSIILQILKKHHYFFFVKCALSRLLSNIAGLNQIVAYQYFCTCSNHFNVCT